MFLRLLILFISCFVSVCSKAQGLPSCENVATGRCWYSGSVYVGNTKTADFYEGEVLNRLFHGKGTYWYWEENANKGDKYEGDFVAGFASGKGTYYSNSGDKYIGEIRKNVWHGYGTYHYSDGSIYEGYFVNGRKEGKGTYAYKNGDKHVGSYLKNLANGFGVYYSFADGKNKGDRYEGGFKDGAFSGQGTYYFADGDKYVGPFLNNQPNGFGVFYFLANNRFRGDRYEGNFDGWNYSGIGTYFHQNGNKVVCVRSSGKCNGSGVVTYDGGAKYVGEFQNGLRHGQGVLYNPSGVVIRQGLWSEDEFVLSKTVASSVLNKANSLVANTGQASKPISQSQHVPSKTSEALAQKCKNLGLAVESKDFELCLRSLKK